MMRSIAVLLVVLAVLPGRMAHAEDCGADSTQMELTQCAVDRFAASDSELNAVYRQVRQRLGDLPDSNRRLVAAQRAWIAFRDAECGFEASAVAGGSLAPMIIADCRDRLTRLRVEDLTRDLSCQEGDTTCPVPPAP